MPPQTAPASTSASASSGSQQNPGGPEPIPPVGYLSRKALPIKRNDAEPLTREDVQYDMLFTIFDDNQAVFHSTTPGKMCSFRELYIAALYNSNKCSKVLKDKMQETPAFGVELGKISLLTNVGRINTTMAFFPEMKTALRTYHPVPSLQKTDGNAQDAPRIKNCLKAALLPSEFKSVPPSTPDEILAKSRAGMHPSTSVVNLIFVLSNHAAPLANVHFDGTINFLDLFLPKPLSSQDRGRAFLWLMYHYLENPDGPNPFDDQYSHAHPGKAPRIKRLSKEEAAKENVDSPEEKKWGADMSNQRNTFLTKLVSAAAEERKKQKNYIAQFVAAPDRRPPPNKPYMVKAATDKTDHAPHPSFMYYVPNSQPGTFPRRHAATYPYSDAPRPVTPVDERSGLEQAWWSMDKHRNDPLKDSDDEEMDAYSRHDCNRRLDVLNRLRGRSPTPDVSMDDDAEPLGRFRQVIEWD